MGSLLEEMHKMRLKEKIEELESIGGNPHVEDHGLGGVYRCKVCGYIFDENREGRPFTTLSNSSIFSFKRILCISSKRDPISIPPVITIQNKNPS